MTDGTEGSRGRTSTAAPEDDLLEPLGFNLREENIPLRGQAGVGWWGSLPALAVLPAIAVGLAAHLVTRATRPEADWIAERLGGPALVRLSAELPDGSRTHAPFSSSGS